MNGPDQPSSQGHSEHQHGQHGGGHEHGGMGQRGVTRPMHEQGQHAPPPNPEEGQRQQVKPHEGATAPGMSLQQKQQMLMMHHKRTLWVYWTVILLGLWMLVFPATFSYAVGAVAPSGGRGVWLSESARALAMTISDVVSGLLLIALGYRALKPDRPLALWACCFVGIWLTFAPVIFWSPTAVGYLNSTIVGMLVISLTILIPGMPNMIKMMQPGPEQPPGWTYNPSSWPQRAIMIAAGFAGFLVSRYLAAFQLGYITWPWDPFFGNSSERVLNSSMSHAWPVSDAAFGALAYTFEFLMGFMGSPARWRTMPWMVAFFGILVIPLGLVHILLVISQPVVVGHWCTFCLLAAAIMLPMIPLEVDEVAAMIQFMIHSKRKGEPMWRTFWKGGTLEMGGPDRRSPEMMALNDNPRAVLAASVWGMSVPWTLLATTAIGIYLMFSPAIFSTTGWDAHIAHLGGALIVTCSVIAMGEVVRTLRFANCLLALAVGIVPWFADGGTAVSAFNASMAGVLVFALSLPRGPVREKYDGWSGYIY